LYFNISRLSGNKADIRDGNESQTNEKRKRNERKTNERFTPTIRETNERTIQKMQTNERTIQEQANHWSVTIYYPMTNDPGSIEVQYNIFYSSPFSDLF
jgi:hypothetical protein